MTQFGTKQLSFLQRQDCRCYAFLAQSNDARISAELQNETSEDNQVLVIRLNGKTYTLDTAQCTGGVVFRKPVSPDEICIQGSFEVRSSFCNHWNPIYMGTPTKYLCMEGPSRVQSFHPRRTHLPPTISTTTSTPNPHIIQGAPPSFKQEVVPFNPTLSPMFGANLYDEDLNPNVKNSHEEQFDHTNVLRKRNPNPSDLTSDYPDAASDPMNQTSRVESVKFPKGEMEGMSTDTDDALKEKGDLLPMDDSEKSIPGLMAVGDKIVNEDIQSQQLPEAKDEKDKSPSSSENDDLGEWEDLSDVLAQIEYNPLPPRNTLEYDAVTGGMDKWFHMSPSPIFDSHVAILKAQVGKVLMGEDASVLEPMQPRNMTWYRLLEKAALVADHMIPPPLLPDRGSKPPSTGGSSEGFQSQFFYHALQIFSYFARTIMDDDVDVGLGDAPDFWEGVLAGMTKCVDIASEEGRQKKFILTPESDSNCDKLGDLEASQILSLRWSDYGRNFSVYNYTINYTHNLDPNTYLPPHSARINPSLWIFAEVMWYTIQLSYAYCFIPLGDESPDLFMMAYAKLIKIFETPLMQTLWTPTAENSGGNLEVYENFLPYVQHSAEGDSNIRANSEDFERTLINLDKVSFAVHEQSLLNHWIQRPSKRGRKDKSDSESSYWDVMAKGEKRRRKRRAVGEEGSVDIKLSTESPTPKAENIVGVIRNVKGTEKPEVVKMEEATELNKPANVNIEAPEPGKSLEQQIKSTEEAPKVIEDLIKPENEKVQESQTSSPGTDEETTIKSDLVLSEVKPKVVVVDKASHLVFEVNEKTENLTVEEIRKEVAKMAGETTTKPFNVINDIKHMERDRVEHTTEAIFPPAVEAEMERSINSDAGRAIDGVLDNSATESELRDGILETISTTKDNDPMKSFGVTPAISVVLEDPNASTVRASTEALPSSTTTSEVVAQVLPTPGLEVSSSTSPFSTSKSMEASSTSTFLSITESLIPTSPSSILTNEMASSSSSPEVISSSPMTTRSDQVTLTSSLKPVETSTFKPEDTSSTLKLDMESPSSTSKPEAVTTTPSTPKLTPLFPTLKAEMETPTSESVLELLPPTSKSSVVDAQKITTSSIPPTSVQKSKVKSDSSSSESFNRPILQGRNMLPNSVESYGPSLATPNLVSRETDEIVPITKTLFPSKPVSFKLAEEPSVTYSLNNDYAMETKNSLKEYEIWDDLAYCLIQDDYDIQAKNGYSTVPRTQELQSSGICEN